jgi:hypothetical protein
MHMKLIIDVNVLLNEPNNNHLFGAARRTLETDLVPAEGMEIEDSAWKHPRVIKRVTMNPEEGYYLVWAGDDETDEKERAKNQLKMYQSHGWEVLSGI